MRRRRGWRRRGHQTAATTSQPADCSAGDAECGRRHEGSIEDVDGGDHARALSAGAQAWTAAKAGTMNKPASSRHAEQVDHHPNAGHRLPKPAESVSEPSAAATSPTRPAKIKAEQPHQQCADRHKRKVRTPAARFCRQVRAERDADREDAKPERDQSLLPPSCPFDERRQQ